MKREFEKYCKNYQDIENYEKAKKDNFEGWECHHRLETHFPDGKRRDDDISHKKLKALGMYYNRPPEELIFLPKSEHSSFNKGKKRSAETRRKMKGNKNALGCKRSDETRRKMSEAKKNMSEETRRKMSAARKGRHWFNNGKESKFCFECPPGFTPGRLS